MLVLSRKKGQSIMVGSDIEISIVDIQGDQIRLGIDAPRNIAIHRKEVFEEIIKENKQAASVALDPELIKTIKIRSIENKKNKEKK